MIYRKVDLPDMLEKLQGKLIVSCQALEHEPLFGAELMAKMSVGVVQGGAAGIRANYPADIAAIRQALPDIPLFGIYKYDVPGYAVRITPTLRHAIAIAGAGCDVIGLDATDRPRPEESLAEIFKGIKKQTGLPILADVSTYEEAMTAAELGADMLSTTLSGYTPYSPQQEEPDLILVEKIASQIALPLLAEGRFNTPDLARQALEAGAFAVVVGSAITRPDWITRQFVKALA